MSDFHSFENRLPTKDMQNLKTFSYYTSYCEVTIGATWSTVVAIIPMPTPVASPTRQQFDYALLDSATSEFVQRRTQEIKERLYTTAKTAWEIGQKLAEVRERLEHGNFCAWLAAEFHWSERTAYNYMSVFENFDFATVANLEIATSALYLLAASSTPEAARTEALALASAGEHITRSAAVAIKRKYTKPKTKQPLKQPKQLEPQPEPELPAAFISPTPLPAQSPTSATPIQPGTKKLEIVAIRSKAEPTPTESTATSVITTQVTTKVAPVSTPPVATPDVPGVWWQLGRHLLYCGDPNSYDFQQKVAQKVSLLLAFPPNPGWFPAIQAETYLISNKFLPAGKNLDQLDENLESIILFHSNLKDLVVSCFLPSLDILYIINRSDRWGLIAEPSEKRCTTIISDWKKNGFKVERVT